jgi:hypothetical protein
MRKRRKPDDRNPELVGRAREAASLAKLVRAAAAKRGATVLISGEAGIGKTALLNSALADSRLVDLRAAASPAGGAPFGPIISLLHALQRNTKGKIADKAEAVLHLLAAADGKSEIPANRAALFC